MIFDVLSDELSSHDTLKMKAWFSSFTVAFSVLTKLSLKKSSDLYLVP